MRRRVVRGKWTYSVSQQGVCSSWLNTTIWHCESTPRLSSYRSPWLLENNGTCIPQLLMAWNGMLHCQICKSYHLCNRTKTFPTVPMGKLLPNQVPSWMWQVISVDLIVELPTSHRYDALLVVVDHLSKWVHLIRTTSDINSVRVARLFQDYIWRHHGLSEEIISDCGTQFVCQFMCELSKLLGIKTAASAAYYPQTDGQTEHINQEIEQYLRLFVNQRQDDWYKWVSLAEFTYNNWIHSSTQTTPFMLDNGQHPRLGIEPIWETRLETLREFTDCMEMATNEVYSALQRAANDMARFYDVHCQHAPTYKVGNKVWLNAQNIITTWPTKNLDHKWLGPYSVDKVISQNTYQLQLPSSFDYTHPVFLLSIGIELKRTGRYVKEGLVD